MTHKTKSERREISKSQKRRKAEVREYKPREPKTYIRDDYEVVYDDDWDLDDYEEYSRD